jgi:hypothetical protein
MADARASGVSFSMGTCEVATPRSCIMIIDTCINDKHLNFYQFSHAYEIVIFS